MKGMKIISHVSFEIKVKSDHPDLSRFNGDLVFSKKPHVIFPVSFIFYIQLLFLRTEKVS